MSDELVQHRDEALRAMADVEYMPVVPEYDLSSNNTTTVSLANLASLGVAFQPITSAIQAVITGEGGSGLYFVNTFGKNMHTHNQTGNYIGSLKNAAGTVGGGQAQMTALPVDPTMICMAVALMNIEKKLDTIQETQMEILAFLEEKERAVLQGNLNTLNDVLSNFKFNWNNETYKNNKHILVQQIKKEAESSIVLYRELIVKKAKKRSFFHSDRDVNNTLKSLQSYFKDYQLALYLYSYATFLEVMLLGNYEKCYLEGIENRIREYAMQYRTLYTDCYNTMEDYTKSSIQSGLMGSLATAGKFVGETIAKIPVVSNSQLDENLIESSEKLAQSSAKRANTTMEKLAETRENVTVLFIQNIREINDLYNKPFECFFDESSLYIQQTAE